MRAAAQLQAAAPCRQQLITSSSSFQAAAHEGVMCRQRRHQPDKLMSSQGPASPCLGCVSSARHRAFILVQPRSDPGHHQPHKGAPTASRPRPDGSANCPPPAPAACPLAPLPPPARRRLALLGRSRGWVNHPNPKSAPNEHKATCAARPSSQTRACHIRIWPTLGASKARDKAVLVAPAVGGATGAAGDTPLPPPFSPGVPHATA